MSSSVANHAMSELCTVCTRLMRGARVRDSQLALWSPASLPKLSLYSTDTSGGGGAQIDARGSCESQDSCHKLPATQTIFSIAY